MAKPSKSKIDRDRAHIAGRRSFIKWSVAAGAALGLPRWKMLEVLERSGGVALAAEAACQPTNRSVHIVAGNGGFAWFQLLWPHNEIAAANSDRFSFHAPGQQTMVAGSDRPLTLGPDAPWKNLVAQRQVTALMVGRNQTHTGTPDSNSTIAANTSLYATAAAMQSTNPTLVPVITVGGLPLGTAAGAPRAAQVGNGRDIVALFDSAASRAGGVLEASGDAQLYSASYDALLSLHAAAGRSTAKRAFATGRGAAGFLGTNLGGQLRPSDADLARYGITGGSPTKLRVLAETLIVTAKSFALGLTSSVVVPAMNDDPHGAFGDMANLRMTIAGLGKLLDAFMADLAATDDPGCAGAKLSDNIVMTINGDTPKTPLDRNGWGDGTPGNSNWMYVLGSGWLKSGWFGSIRANGDMVGFDPLTGNDANVSSNANSAVGAAAVAYAIAKGDMRRVRDFYDGSDLTGLIRATQM